LAFYFLGFSGAFLMGRSETGVKGKKKVDGVLVGVIPICLIDWV
jgi:hypothetical protein